MKDIIDTAVGICVLIVILFTHMFIGLIAHINAREGLIQELCTKKQYDFCEVVEHKTEYRLKEQDDEI